MVTRPSARPGEVRGTVAVAVESPSVIRFFVVFVALQALLFGAELTPWAQEYFVVPWTNALAAVSAWLVTLFDAHVVATGKVLQHTVNGFAVSIEAGCNGVEATIVLVAAIFAFPAPWKSRLVGLAAGIVAVQGLNVIRVISLFYLGQWSLSVFEWAHLYVWQALIMLDVLIVWLVWVRTLPRAPLAPAAAVA
jgi:exosortase H (IPTLxxWG-CTERM-specific)